MSDEIKHLKAVLDITRLQLANALAQGAELEALLIEKKSTDES
jgi:hypothetical protein